MLLPFQSDRQRPSVLPSQRRGAPRPEVREHSADVQQQPEDHGLRVRAGGHEARGRQGHSESDVLRELRVRAARDPDRHAVRPPPGRHLEHWRRAVHHGKKIVTRSLL